MANRVFIDDWLVFSFILEALDPLIYEKIIKVYTIQMILSITLVKKLLFHKNTEIIKISVGILNPELQFSSKEKNEWLFLVYIFLFLDTVWVQHTHIKEGQWPILVLQGTLGWTHHLYRMPSITQKLTWAVR